MGISELQTFLYVLASRFAHPPDRSHRCPRLRQGSRGFYVRAEHASLPPHASDMLAVRIQVIDGERTFTPPDSQPYRLLLTTCSHDEIAAGMSTSSGVIETWLLSCNSKESCGENRRWLRRTAISSSGQ